MPFTFSNFFVQGEEKNDHQVGRIYEKGGLDQNIKNNTKEAEDIGLGFTSSEVELKETSTKREDEARN